MFWPKVTLFQGQSGLIKMPNAHRENLCCWRWATIDDSHWEAALCWHDLFFAVDKQKTQYLKMRVATQPFCDWDYRRLSFRALSSTQSTTPSSLIYLPKAPQEITAMFLSHWSKINHVKLPTSMNLNLAPIFEKNTIFDSGDLTSVLRLHASG